MGDAPMVTSAGRAYPVETRWLGRSPDASLRSFSHQVRAVNEELSAWAEEHSIIFADLSALLSPDGERLDGELSDDGLHLNGRGYERIGPTLVRLIEG